MTPVEQLVLKLEETQRTFQNANLLIAKGILEPTLQLAKELLVVERMRLGESYQKGHAAGVVSGKLEASITKI